MDVATTMRERDDLDSPWKEALERYFPEFMELLFPEVAREVDWSKGFEFCDTELQKIVRDSEVGRRYADKLVKVYILDGSATWLMIHVEVQGEPDRNFAERMYTYNYRLYDRYQREVVSLAVVTDAAVDGDRGEYRRQRAGCELIFRYPCISLLDWRTSWDELESMENRFAVVVMAHIKAGESRDGEHRRHWKMQLIRMLYQRGLSREDILELFRLIDWVITLPPGVEEKFHEELNAFEEEMQMPYITSVERRGILKGEAAVLLRQMERKYGSDAAQAWRQKVAQADSESLLFWTDRILTAKTIDEIFH